MNNKITNQNAAKLDKHPSRIGQMFNRIAPTYDFLNHFLSVGIDLKWRKMAVKDLSVTGRELVLDLACGTGDLGFAALEKAPECRVIGVDLALKMLEIAKEKANKKKLTAMSYLFLSGDILNLPFRDSTFDKAMIAFGIRNVVNTKKAFVEICRVLKPGGRLAVLEFSLPRNVLFKDLYMIYFKKILPFVGGLVSRDPEAYSYLPSSVDSFTPPEVLSLEMKNAGFRIAKTKFYTGGISYLILADKPA